MSCSVSNVGTLAPGNSIRPDCTKFGRYIPYSGDMNLSPNSGKLSHFYTKGVNM